MDTRLIDIALYNGSVITVNAKDEIAQAVGIKKNKIVFVGKNEEIMQYISDTTTVIDLKGATLMPGIIDSHVHPILNGFIGNEADAAIVNTGISQCKSVAEMLDLFKQAVAVRKKGEWISSMGYEPMFLEEKRHPTIEELDAVAPDNPLQCMHVGGHICMYNSKALEYLDVYGPEDAARYPENEIEVIDGKLTGMVKDHTHFKLWSKVAYTPKQQRCAAMKSQEIFLKNGITSIHDCGECDGPSYQIMQELCNTREFKIRTYMMLHSIYGKPFSLVDNEHYLALGLRSGLGNEYFKIGGSKFMIDGGSGGPSCATREPYSHDPNLKGILGWTREEVSDYILKLHNAGCQATAHAIGDLAIEFMIEGFERAQTENPDSSIRHRIEHCTLVDQNFVERMARLNISPTLNAGMIVSQGKHYAKLYGPKRCKYLIALRSMLDAGMKPALASDAPSGPMGLAMIDGAVNRYDRTEGYQFDRTQSISVLEAIRCATYHAAYAAYEENIKGSIEVGKLADVIVLNDDILKINPKDINKLTVRMTMIDGEIVYSGQE